jgi:hypothetical protein
MMGDKKVTDFFLLDANGELKDKEAWKSNVSWAKNSFRRLYYDQEGQTESGRQG